MSQSSLTASNWTAELYDYITIGAALPVETAAPVTASAQTGDIVLCAALLGIVSAIAVFRAKKKA